MPPACSWRFASDLNERAACSTTSNDTVGEPWFVVVQFIARPMLLATEGDESPYYRHSDNAFESACFKILYLNIYTNPIVFW